jgi:Photosynthetic reaction centre cytochrome C subunit
MKTIFILIFISASVALFSSFSGSWSNMNPRNFNCSDTAKEERQKYIQQILEKLQDKKDIGADSVFSNLKTFTGDQSLAVKHLLAVMDYWGQSLNVSCTYCHNTNKWESDEIKQKQIARDMFAMRLTINREILTKIQNLRSNPARINCGTCHRGSAVPQAYKPN